MAIGVIKMQSKPLVTVIVPVYNTSKYLKRCVESIINQTYKKVEIILVDDGSTDHSSLMCDQFAERDERIKVIHKANGGLSTSRNRGLDEATGEWIVFVDSDDWISLNTIEFCVNYIQEDSSLDIVQYGILKVKTVDEAKSDNGTWHNKYKSKSICRKMLFESLWDEAWFSCCRCLFNSNVIGSLRFRVGKINEDIDFKYHAFQRAKHVLDCNAKKYYYFQDKGSITTDALRPRDFDLYDAVDELKKYIIEENDGEMLRYAEIKYAKVSLSLLCKAAYFGVSDDFKDKKTVIKMLIKNLRKDFWILLTSPIKISRKILVIGFSINYKITESCVQMVKNILK